MWILVPICLKFSAETLALVEKKDLKGLNLHYQKALCLCWQHQNEGEKVTFLASGAF